jgi:hypothetical protein
VCFLEKAQWSQRIGQASNQKKQTASLVELSLLPASAGSLLGSNFALEVGGDTIL